MFKNVTLSTVAIAVALTAILPVTGASAKTVKLAPAATNDLVLEPAYTTPLPPLKTPEIFLPPKISCASAKQAIRTNGYKKVKKIECDGFVYTFKGKKNGKKYAIAINAVTKKIWTL